MSETQQATDGAPARDPQGNLIDARTTGTQETEPSSEKTDPSLLNKTEEGTKEPDKATGAPEKYEDFTAPEGFELDKEVVEKAIPIFKELGLNQEGAQKLVNLYSEISKSAADAPVEFFLQERKAWKDALTNDPEIGGTKLAESKATINRALDTILSKADAAAFREAMDFTGAGDHPAFARAIFKMASLLTETPAKAHVTGNGPTKESQTASGRAERPSTASALYPNLP